MRSFTFLFSSSVCALALGACAASGSNSLGAGVGGSGASGGAGGSSGSGSGGTSNGGSSSGTGGAAGGISVGGGGAGGSEQGPPVLYANTDTVLFKLDPQSFALTQIGSFDCLSGSDSAMTDIAVDKSLNLWGISEQAVHPLTVQGSTVHCGTAINLNNPTKVKFFGLTFAPAGVLDPNNEVLIGANSAGELWEIDANGNLSQHGTFGTVPANDGNGHTYKNAGKAWELSGDIVFLANGGSPIGFATVRDCPSPPNSNNCDASDTLIEINVPLLKTASATQSVTQSVRGEIVAGSNCSTPTTGSLGSFYGIAALNDKVYGFARDGEIVSVNTSDGTACLVQDFSKDLWAGAGVTTLAPVKPPPVK
jgi:hypothetical protein